MIRLAAGEAVGTLLVSQTQPWPPATRWLADHLQTAGRLILDAGAVAAPARRQEPSAHRRPSPPKAISNGAPPSPASPPTAAEIARGLSNYGSGESRLIARKPSLEIESILGYVDEPELIHRDNLILVG